MTRLFEHYFSAHGDILDGCSGRLSRLWYSIAPQGRQDNNLTLASLTLSLVGSTRSRGVRTRESPRSGGREVARDPDRGGTPPGTADREGVSHGSGAVKKSPSRPHSTPRGTPSPSKNVVGSDVVKPPSEGRKFVRSRSGTELGRLPVAVETGPFSAIDRQRPSGDRTAGLHSDGFFQTRGPFSCPNSGDSFPPAGGTATHGAAIGMRDLSRSQLPIETKDRLAAVPRRRNALVHSSTVASTPPPTGEPETGERGDGWR
eukprot:CAMPEP_0119135758 /NCGR_PEP_ID=MMETSP1310-20130426/19991_1 /TAXON_ID=464262 /ORGANISM="Genus nov. species nov., Strain RCC2339" /LENGTH=258 /DNA_ID=CAMNT_0007126683 /DNA_START=23 /DNA_END=795 /DNA_ORIENTATION=+